MVLRYGVLKNASPTDNIDMLAYCEQFYSITDDPYQEKVGVFSSFADANLYAKHQMSQLRDKGETNVNYPIYAIEFEEDENVEYEEQYGFGVVSGSYVGQERVLVNRKIYAQYQFHFLSKITHIFCSETGACEQQPTPNNIDSEWQLARYAMLEKRLKQDLLPEFNADVKINIARVVQKLLTECAKLKNKGDANDCELADTLALMDDAINKRLSQNQFEKRLNKLQGNSVPSYAMQRVGTILAVIGAILLASGVFLCSAGTAAAGAGALAAGAGFFAVGAARPTGLCKLTGELNIDNAPYFQR